MSHLQAGIKSIEPLSSSVAPGSTWDQQAAVCTSICELILKSARGLDGLNPLYIGSVIKDAVAAGTSGDGLPPRDISGLIDFLGFKGICVAGWTSHDKKSLSALISEISLNRYAKLNVLIISLGQRLVTLAADRDHIYIVDPNPRNPITGGKPTNEYSQGVLVELSSFFGIGNYLHNYDKRSFDSPSTTYRATFLSIPSEPDSKVKAEEEAPEPMEAVDEEEKVVVKKEKVSKKRAPDEVEEEEEEEVDEEDQQEEEEEEDDVAAEKPPVRKKRAIGISKRRKSTRGGKK